ncbi:DUF6640 family protein [Nonomuraea dietziae]|uniref:DUF6640 family protein n=1 Tax=Nonomuraea dietziae TaxID=65515 RepID=UPI003413F916
MAGAVLADLVIPDLAAQHAFNEAWPPHAKFHDAQYMVMTVLLGLIGLVLVTRRDGNVHSRLLCAAAILATPWVGMLGALLFPTPPPTTRVLGEDRLRARHARAGLPGSRPAVDIAQRSCRAPPPPQEHDHAWTRAGARGAGRRLKSTDGVHTGVLAGTAVPH